MKTQFELHCLADVKPIHVKEISILMHLRIILAKSDNITNCKLICQADFVRKNIANENNALTPGCSRAKKKNNSLRHVNGVIKL